MKRILALVIMTVVTLGGGATMAQQKAAEKKAADKKEKQEDVKKEEKKDDKVLEAIKDIYRRLDIGVKIYMDWYSSWGFDNAAYDRITNGTNRWKNGLGTSPSDMSPKNNNTFRINRAYLDLKYKITDFLSARLTTDVDASVTPNSTGVMPGNSAGVSNAPNAAFHIYLKYAYLEAKHDFGPVMLSATGGMIETPIIGFVDRLSDYRWIGQNYIDQSKTVLNGQSIDNSADLGVKASVGIMKWVTLTGSFTNGEGYKSNENLSQKAITFLADINPAPIEPIKGLHAIGFGRYEITNKYDWTGRKAKREFFGYGVHYSTDLIKAGVNHAFVYVRQVGAASYFGSAYKFGSQELYIYPQRWQGYELLDAYVNLSLGAKVPEVPLIITGRYTHGLQRKTYQKLPTDPEFGKTRSTDNWGLGIGWQFNKNFRLLVGGEIQKFYVKKNIALRSQESTSGTDTYNGTALGIGTQFAGSHNPHDAKRLYVKAEATF